MARQRDKATVQRTIHLRKEVDKWLKELADDERRSVNNMIDVLLHRQYQREARS